MQIGTLLRSLGAIGVNRRENTNFVDTAVKMFKEEEQLFLIIAPEGVALPNPLAFKLIHSFRNKILLRRLEDGILSNRRKGGSPNSTWLCRVCILMLSIQNLI